LLSYITSSSPKPSKPIRRLIANSFNIIYTKADSRNVFDTISAIQTQLAKKIDDVAVKICAIHCLGCITEIHGSKVQSLFAETLILFTKALKGAKEAEIPLRYETLKSMAMAIRGAGKGCQDSTIKELQRIAKAGMLEKYPLIRSASAEVC
jgi:HEAT repeat-containing protein 5